MKSTAGGRATGRSAGRAELSCSRDQGREEGACDPAMCSSERHRHIGALRRRGGGETGQGWPRRTAHTSVIARAGRNRRKCVVERITRLKTEVDERDDGRSDKQETAGGSYERGGAEDRMFGISDGRGWADVPR